MSDNAGHIIGIVEKEEKYISVDERVELRVLYYCPATETSGIPVLIISGLATMVESFEEVIFELSKNSPVYFIETRDRHTSRIAGKTEYGIPAMGRDIVRIIEALGFKDKDYVLMGYSFGASIMSECYSLLREKPKCLIFMEPTPEFHYPGWSLVVIRLMGKPLYRILRPVAKWYMRRFYINTAEDNEMAVISGRSLDNADPVKLINTILAIAPYKVWPKLAGLTCPSLVVGTSKDRLHVPEDIQRMVRELRDCTFIDMETNLRTHSREMGNLVYNYIMELDS
jgi:pimeloyl-ACP methyl ester carboxylesterase